ncbi:pilus assembly protein TadG-related protein [Roseobacteraceae bacterium S113]
MKMMSSKETHTLAESRAELRASTGLTSRMRRFAREEDGNLTVMSVFMFVGIVAICGVGVDLMMNEMKRTKLQHTLDRAILAAADLDQSLDPESVVQDYFATSGMGSALSSVTVDEGLNYRTVSATATTTSDPLFLGVMGVDELVAPAAGTAEERVGNVEISMVLDISGSMGWTGSDGRPKLDNLQDASEEFLDTVLQSDTGGLTTVNIIPYNHTVNMGDTFASYYNLSSTHNYSNCAIFPTSSFTSLGVSRSAQLERLSHFDIWNYNWNSTSIGHPLCPTNDYAEIKVHQTNRNALVSHVDSFYAGGNTAIDLGMKWGVALLDPSAQSTVSAMISDGEIIADAANRPAQYDDGEAMKILVLMTDGENTSQFNLRSNLRSGWSDVYVDERGTSSRSDDRYSVKVRDWSGTSNDMWYWERYRDWSWNSRYRNYSDGNVRRLTHQELYERFNVNVVEDRFFDKPYWDGWISWNDYQDYYYAYDTMVGSDSADSRLSTICSAARNAGITVYSIAFEAPARGQAAMQSCASSTSHYFDVNGVEITDAFEAIARTINQLRLTQ